MRIPFALPSTLCVLILNDLFPLLLPPLSSLLATVVAISPNNNDVHVLAFDGKSFKKIAELKEHESRVTGIDWAPKSNQIVTCSEDRNVSL